MASILTNVGSLVTSAIGWVEEMVDVVVAQPVLTLFVIAVPLVGLGVGLLNRLIRAN